jgi:hypothetical protein
MARRSPAGWPQWPGLVLLGSKAALAVMTCLLVIVAFTLIVLMVARMA